MSVRVDRCVCFARPFSELLAIAKKTGAKTLEDLQEETEFGLSCRICNPYVRRMLQTGETSFSVLLEDDEPLDDTPPAGVGKAADEPARDPES